MLQQHHPKRDQCPAQSWEKALEKVPGVRCELPNCPGTQNQQKGTTEPREGMEREGRLGFSRDEGAGGEKSCSGGEGKGPA